MSEHAAEVWVRRYNGVPECDVVVAVRGQERSFRCRDYNEAAKMGTDRMQVLQG
jgi:hypothetical protein